VLVVPELSGDEDVLALETRDLVESLLDTLTNLTLVLVDLGKIKVTVASLEGLVDTVADLTRGSLPCAVTDLGNLPSRVESDSATERHDCGCFECVVVVDLWCWFENEEKMEEEIGEKERGDIFIRRIAS
jgi:hypothetical protein